MGGTRGTDRETFAMNKIAVIIVTYNSERHIYDCLKALFRYNDIGDSLEVIVVDNCSRDYDAMRRKIKETYGNMVRVVANTKNGGYGQGNNVGIKMATSPIIMVMNPDVRLCEHVFGMVWTAFERDSHLVMYGLTQRHKDGTLGRSVAWTSRVYPYIAEPMRYLCGIFNIYWQRYMYICGACFFVRKNAFEKAGLFDENIFMFNEEEDIHGRLLKDKGARIYYDRHNSYWHLHPPVTDYAAETHEWQKRSLDSLIYLNEREGLNREKTINWSIKRTNVSILSERVRLLVGRGNKDRLLYFKEWKNYLMSLEPTSGI